MKRPLQLITALFVFATAFPAVAYFEYQFSTDLQPEYTTVSNSPMRDTREWPLWIGRMGDDVPDVLVFTGGSTGSTTDWPTWIGRMQ
ncbi:MAG: hypothetical protein O2904_04185 [bacterium]|nr:hypothetical protein [bacterium]